MPSHRFNCFFLNKSYFNVLNIFQAKLSHFSITKKDILQQDFLFTKAALQIDKGSSILAIVDQEINIEKLKTNLNFTFTEHFIKILRVSIVCFIFKTN